MGVYYTQQFNSGSGLGTGTTVDVDSSTQRVVGDWQYIIINTDGTAAIVVPSGWTTVGTTPNGKGVVVKRQYQMGDSTTTGTFTGGSLGANWPRSVLTLKSSGGSTVTIDSENVATNVGATNFTGPTATGATNFWSAIAMCIFAGPVYTSAQPYYPFPGGSNNGAFINPVPGGGSLAAITWSSAGNGLVVIVAADDGGNPSARKPFQDLTTDQMTKLRGYNTANTHRGRRDIMASRMSVLNPFRDRVQREYGGGVSLY